MFSARGRRISFNGGYAVELGSDGFGLRLAEILEDDQAASPMDTCRRGVARRAARVTKAHEGRGLGVPVAELREQIGGTLVALGRAGPMTSNDAATYPFIR